MVKLYNRTSLTTAQLLQGSSGARAKIWSNVITRQAYLLQYSHSHTSVELESQNLVKLYTRQSLHATAQPLPDFSRARVPKFGQILQLDKPNTTAQLLQGSSRARTKIWSNYTTRQSLRTTAQLLQCSSAARAKIWSNYTQDKAYILQHSYSQTSVELGPKFDQIICKTKPTYYNTATPRLQWS